MGLRLGEDDEKGIRTRTDDGVCINIVMLSQRRHMNIKFEGLPFVVVDLFLLCSGYVQTRLSHLTYLVTSYVHQLVATTRRRKRYRR